MPSLNVKAVGIPWCTDVVIIALCMSTVPLHHLLYTVIKASYAFHIQEEDITPLFIFSV